MNEAAAIKTTPKDCWSTPPFVYGWAARRWGDIGIDLAANADNAVIHRWLGPGSDWHEDALASDCDWGVHLTTLLNDDCAQLHAWCNPPYSNIDPWVEKAIAAKAEGLSVTLLIPAMPGEARFRQISKHATEIVFVIGRLAFLDGDDKPVSGNQTGSCLVHFRAYDCGPPRVLWVERDVMREEVA